MCYENCIKPREEVCRDFLEIFIHIVKPVINFPASGNYYAILCSYSTFTLFILGNTYSFLSSLTYQDMNLLLIQTVKDLKLLQHTSTGLIQYLFLFPFFCLWLGRKNPKCIQVHLVSGAAPMPILSTPVFRLACSEVLEVTATTHLYLP